ncbi:MAG: hypothetical protein H6703_12720 [Myxococcales bacterium]|nr:hypothetical protein [Myxococcales bacterium]
MRPPPQAGEAAAGAVEAGADEAARLALALTLIDAAGSASDGDRAVVAAEMAKMPTSALEVLRDEGTRVKVCHNSVTEVREDLRGVRPRGWPPGMTWDTVPGLYDPGRNWVIIALRGGAVPARGDGHGAHNLVIHEVGHAVDHDTSGSDQPEFIAARDADLATLSGYESQAGSAGREESYGESMARYHGGDAGDAAAHPNLHRFWAADPIDAQIRRELEAAAGPEGTDAQVRDTIKHRHLTRATPPQKAALIMHLLERRSAANITMIRTVLASGGEAEIRAALQAEGRLDDLERNL